MEPECVRLLEELERLLPNSYAPYSGVHVAAAVVADDGTVYYGVNVENASLGLTICAERSAVAAMVTAGRRGIRCVAIVADTPSPLPPCGACRQVLAEFAPPSAKVVSRSAVTGETVEWSLGELLPHAFTPSHLPGRSRGKDGGSA